jgi:putative ABC transport system permease protein
MGNLFKIAIRNLLRYKRRTLLTASLITIGVVFVLLFISIFGSFKNMMIAQVTDTPPLDTYRSTERAIWLRLTVFPST